MKQAMTLTQLAQTLELQAAEKKDYIADTRRLEVTDGAKNLQLGGVGNMPITNNARRQLAEKLSIPMTYFDRLSADHPDLLQENVNTLFKREPKSVMVRTLHGDARAFLSDRYRPLDNYDLADAILPVLKEFGVQVESCNVTEQKMYIKALAPWLDREIPMPDGWEMGKGHNIWVRKVMGAITISNSEVGAGGLNILPGVFEKQCTNLATFRSDGFNRVHIGKKASNENDESVFAFLSDETRKLDDAAVWSKARDVVRATLDGRVIDSIVAKMAEARGDRITGDPVKVVEVFSKRHSLNQEEKGGLLRHLTESGEMTRYGLQWAATRLSQDVEDYDRASDLERLGGNIIELSKSDWQELAKAA